MGWMERKLQERAMMKWAEQGLQPISAADVAWLKGNYKREVKAALTMAKQAGEHLGRREKKEMLEQVVGPEPPITKRGDVYLIEAAYLARVRNGGGPKDHPAGVTSDEELGIA